MILAVALTMTPTIEIRPLRVDSAPAAVIADSTSGPKAQPFVLTCEATRTDDVFESTLAMANRHVEDLMAGAKSFDDLIALLQESIENNHAVLRQWNQQQP